MLDRLGIPMSNAAGMFLRQIVLQRGIPFEMKFPAYEEPVAIRKIIDFGRLRILSMSFRWLRPTGYLLRM